MKTRILRISGIVVAILAAILFTTPYLFKGEVSSIIRAQFKKDLRANVNFSDVNISLFRNFPKISFGLDNLTISCVGEFQDDTLLRAKQLDIACNLKSLLSGNGIQVNNIIINEPVFHALVHANGHANWNLFIDSAFRPTVNGQRPKESFDWALQHVFIHKGSLEYVSEGKNIHIVAENLEQECAGNFSDEQYDLKTHTIADAVNARINGSIPWSLKAKTNINVTLHVDSKTHTYSFNTDQVVFNDLKMHTDGFFQWINDSSYTMNIRYKVPSTEFRNLVSLLPSVYTNNYASLDARGNANFNGYIRGKYDAGHSPAYHSNLYVMNGYLKYPDLPLAVEHINLGVQLNNPDGVADHLAINITDAHAEINKDTIDMHLLVKNLKSKPYIDFALIGKMDLANISRSVKMDSSVRLSGTFLADVRAKGNIPGKEKQKKEHFQSDGDLQIQNFSFVSRGNANSIALDNVLMTCTPDRILIEELAGRYGATNVNVSGTLNNFYDYALRSKPLNATLDLKTDEINLRDMPMAVPSDLDLTVNAQAEKLHFDNLDLQNMVCQMQISEQAIHLLYVKANGLDGDIMLEGTYSTLETADHPDISLTYDVKGVDIQKTFLAFNSIRRIMPVAKFMSGNVDAHMTLSGKMNPDMSTDFASLSGQGTVLLINGVIRNFGPMDKLAQFLDVAALKDIPLNNVKSDFSYKNGSVIVSPFTVAANNMEFDIEGVHGFDQSLDYDVSLKMPRAELGKKGNRFVKNVVMQAAEKGIPVKIRDAVRMDVKMAGTINNPDVKTDMNAVVSYAETDLKKQVDAFVNAKLDSAKHQLNTPKAKKSNSVQTSYKTKSMAKSKKTGHSLHKKTAHTKTIKKKKKPGRNYITVSKKTRSTASR